MKKTKNRLMRAAACIGVGVVVLTTAVFANFDNANGYGTIKTAIKNNIFLDNYTMTAEAAVDVDGDVFNDYQWSVKMNRNGNPRMESTNTILGRNKTAYYSDKMIIQDGYRLTDLQQRFSDIDAVNNSKWKYDLSGGQSFPDTMSKDNDMFMKGVNFVESVCDTLVGDVKNNIVLVDKGDGVRTYNINMSGEQLPKYVTAAVSFFSSSMRANKADIDETYSDDEVYDVLQEVFMNDNEPYINNVSGEIQIDNHDRITAFDGRIIISGFDKSGSKKDITVRLSANFGDFDATVIDMVNPDDYEDVSSYMSSYEVDGDSLELNVSENDE